MGDAVFDTFARSQVQFPPAGLEQSVVDASIALLDKIDTPVVLLTHSQSGMFGWSIADARPDKVAAIITVEPAGPPIKAVDFNKVTYLDRPNLVWGVTNLPIQYEPAIQNASELQVELQAQAAAGEVPCYVQTGTPRQLKNLGKIPVLFVVSEAGYHHVYDRCTAKWLQQAGVPTEYVELQNVGLHGNGHMMMLEKNSSDIATYFSDWLAKQLK
jgi:pimeloyl-ACP methyl ester carboxylesterase